jgi:probable F420-dependent oxidoreductase
MPMPVTERHVSRSAVRRGIVFPQGSIASDPETVRGYLRGITDLGYDHLVVPDHVLGADPREHRGWTGVYDIDDSFHELFVLLGFLAAFTTIELVPGVLVLPQRQAVLAAKQAAEVDLLSGGRLRLGVGIGWNIPEYEGLGADFPSRGRRIDEQILLLRRLWTEPSVTFTGEDHVLNGVGIAPLPVQRPIPIWIAAERAPKAFRRVGRLGDGWMAMGPPTDEARESFEIIRESARAAGRDPEAIGIEANVSLGDGDLQRGAEEIAGWHRIGATHVSVNTRSRGLISLDENLERAHAAMNLLDHVL